MNRPRRHRTPLLLSMAGLALGACAERTEALWTCVLHEREVRMASGVHVSERRGRIELLGTAVEASTAVLAVWPDGDGRRVVVAREGEALPAGCGFGHSGAVLREVGAGAVTLGIVWSEGR